MATGNFATDVGIILWIYHMETPHRKTSTEQHLSELFQPVPKPALLYEAGFQLCAKSRAQEPA